MLITEYIVHKDGTVEAHERPMTEKEEERYIHTQRIIERLKNTKSVQAQVDAMLVDHEYRLLLAENGGE